MLLDSMFFKASLRSKRVPTHSLRDIETKGQQDKRDKKDNKNWLVEVGNLGTWKLGNLETCNLSGQKKVAKPLGTKKIMQPLQTEKKSCNLSGQKKSRNIFGQKDYATS